MDPWEKDRLTNFQKLVNLDALPLPPPEEGVVADWRAKLRSPLAGLTVPGWEIFFQHVRAEPGGALGEWGLRREREQLAVRIFVSSLGVEPARLYFCQLAMSSTAPDYPYERAISGEVVTLSVNSPSLDQQTHNHSVLRLFRNVVFDVHAYDAKIDVLQVANDLLNYAQQNSGLPLPSNLPDVKRKGPPEVILPEVQIELPAEPDELDDFEDTDFDVKVETEGKVDFLGFTGQNARFRWQGQTGEGWLRVQVIDRRTLLSQTLTL